MYENLVNQEAGKLLAADIRHNRLPGAILFAGPEASGKLTAALETARILSCHENPQGKWICECPSCLQHKALVCSNLMLLGPRDCSLEISAAAKTFTEAHFINAKFIDAARYLFLRSVRKLTLRFNGILWEGDSNLNKIGSIIEEINENLEQLDFPRGLPDNGTVKKLCEEIQKLCTKLEDDFLYDSIPISQVRNMEGWAHIKSEEGRKTVIIENADRMQTSVRNALLKILEEPPEDVVFILLTSKRNAIMQTILSRVRTYNFTDRTGDQQREVIQRVFHNDDFTGSLNDYLLTYLPVTPSEIKTQAREFYNSVARGEICNIDEIVKKCEKFYPRIELRLFLANIAFFMRPMLGSQAGSEATAQAMQLLRNCSDNITLYNQSPASALEILLRDMFALNKSFGGAFLRGYVKRVKQKAEKLSKEQVLSLLEDVVDENESLYSVFESLSTGLLITDDNFRLLRSNTIAESWLPFSERLEDILGSEKPIWEYIEDEDIAAFLRRCLEKNVTNSSEDFSTVTSGGTVRFLTVTIAPLINEGELNGKMVLVRDITEKKNQDILLHRMENLANLTNLAAGMAHEIKNPLGAISIHIQLIQKALAKARENEDKLPAKKFVEDHIDVVNEEIDHLNKLVMDFLLAVRPVKAQLELKEPDKLIDGLISFFKPEFNREGIEVVFRPSESGIRILLDEKLFRDVIMNISQNSLAALKSKYKSDGEKRIESGAKFCISNTVRENKFIITIADNGCGMSEESLSKIFEPYYTTKANGTGLGMTMVYKIIKEFPGEIIVDSKEGEGTAFTITFPIPQKDTKLLASDGGDRDHFNN